MTPGWRGSGWRWICSIVPVPPLPTAGASWALLSLHTLVTERWLACSLFSHKPIPAPHCRAEKAIKDSKTRHAKQNTV